MSRQIGPAAPSAAQLGEIALRYGFHLSDADLESFRRLMESALESYARLDALTPPVVQVRYPRGPSYRPDPKDNRLNAWYWKCLIKGAADGPLAGKRVVAKDNICVAGVPMMNGSSVLEGYVPDLDATVITRVLDAGGEVVGKATCEHLSFGGSSFTSDTGPVLNPHDVTRATGGSTSGGAALVAVGESELALGTDQGGSIRIPAAWCGVCGLKPTYGLVPYTGIFPIELTQDHVGLIAATVTDIALLLTVVAGEDGLDPRQRNAQVKPYMKSLRHDARGLRIGLLTEGFQWPQVSDPAVDGLVAQAARRCREVGMEIEDVSIPLHRDGVHIWKAIAIEGRARLMVQGNATGTNWKGQYNLSLLEAFARGRQSKSDALSDNVKLVAMLGDHLQNAYYGRYYALAQNLSRTLASAYDAALFKFDVLAMPTAPMVATVLPATTSSREEKFARSLEMNPNTSPFNVTGHPAITIPCGRVGGLPVGLMLVGRRWEEDVVLRAAYALEQIYG